MLVSIVIPCYNSEHTIGKVVELAIQEFEKLVSLYWSMTIPETGRGIPSGV